MCDGGLVMANDMYEVLGLIPSNSDFSLENAVVHFESLFFRNLRIRSELTKAEGESSSHGFRVWYGEWAVVAWLDDSSSVLADNKHLMSKNPLPACPEIIGSCMKRLSVWSDEDPELDHSDEITHFTDELRNRFKMFIFDPVNGGWWT